MMTKQDFILKDQAYQHSRSKRLLGIVASLMGWAGIYAFVFRSFFTSSLPLSSMVASSAIFLIVLLAHIPLARWLSKRLGESYGMNCSQCGQELANALAHRVIATGCCQNCGGLVFNETAAND